MLARSKFIVLISFTFSMLGCGPSIIGAIPSTSPVTAGSVLPLYPIAANWNQYYEVSNPNLTCSVTLGTQATAGYGQPCAHGGDKKIVVTNQTSCTGLTATDALGQFTWTCKVISGFATFKSRLSSTGNLSSLLTTTPSLGWKNEYVIIQSNGQTVYTGTPAQWWPNNPVVAAPSAASVIAPLNGVTAGTIFVVSSSATNYGYFLDEDQIGLVIMPGAVITAAGAPMNCNDTTGTTSSPDDYCFLTTGGHKFMWVEGTINSGTAAIVNGFYIADTAYLTVNNFTAVNFYESGVGDAVFATGTPGYFSNYLTFSNMYLYNNALGIQLDASIGSRIYNVYTSANQSNGGIFFSNYGGQTGAGYNTAVNVTVTGSNSGFNIEGNSNCVLSQITDASNTYGFYTSFRARCDE